MADPMLNRHFHEDGTKAQSALNVQRTGEANNLDSTSSESLITQYIDIWTTAIERKSSAGRGTSNKFSLYGIKKLRELILELAVRGKLVPQASREARNSANYEPASVLLDRIATEKAQLVEEGKLKKPKPLPEISYEEKPFELPNGWEWSRLNDISLLKGGFAFKSSLFLDDGLHQVIRMGNIRPDKLRLNEKAVFIQTEQAQLTKEYQILSGDILLTMTGTKGKRDYLYSLCVDESVLKKRKLYLNQRLCIVRGVLVSTRFVNAVIKCDTLLTDIYAKSTGTANQANIGMEAIMNWPLPIPPLEEQHRIVAKVDELMSLCDALEAQTQASITAHQTLVETLLNALLLPNTNLPADSQSASPESSFADSLEPALNNSFIDSWQRIAEHFDTLFTTAASIDTLKQTILQLAVMGKLVEQDDNDEPAVELIKKNKYGMSEDIVKCGSLPSGWIWTALGNFANCERGRFSIRPRNDPSCYDGDHPFIQIGDLPKFGGVIDCHKQTLNEKGLTVSKKFPENTIVIAIVGATIGNTGMLGYDMCFPDSMVGINTGTRIGNNYLELYLRSLKNKVRNVAYAGGGQPNIKLQILNPLPILVPPSAEQQRIVAKVDELMALCDQLKARLRDAQTTQLHLTDTIVEQAV
jgi:type I restriction enzyme S subunit